MKALHDVEKDSIPTLVDPAVLKTRQGDDEKLPEVAAGLVVSRIEDSPYLLLSFAKTAAHAEDPLTWSVRRRSFITLLAALLVMLVRRLPPCCLPMPVLTPPMTERSRFVLLVRCRAVHRL